MPRRHTWGDSPRHLREDDEIEVRTATLDEPDHGLSDEVLYNTDVLIWWGHIWLTTKYGMK